MADKISVASELYSELSPYKFRRHITCLSKQDYLSPVKFHKSDLGQIYWIDIRNVYKNRGINANHLYEYFGKFSDHTGSEVRQILGNLIEINDMFYRSVGLIVLDMHATSYETWMESVGDETAYADELVLYSLCKLYECHAMVYCQDRNWSTIDPTNPMDAAELHDACQIHLVYLSPGIFSELKWRPFVTPNREFRTANMIKTVQSAQSDSATPLPVNLSKDDSVKSVVSTQSSTDDTKHDKTDEAYKPIVEPVTPEPPEPEPPEPYQPLVEPISPVQSSTEQENVPTTWTTTEQSNSEAGTPDEKLNMSEPRSPYQPVVEPISPVQCDLDGKSNTVAGDTSPAQSDDKVVTTTPPGSPPLMPGHDDERQNTDGVDTEEYEDSITDQNTINGDNIPLDNGPCDIPKPANNLMSSDDTTDVNVCKILTQYNMSGDNESSYTNFDVMKSQNKVVVVTPNRDTNGNNILEAVPESKDDTDMNSHNKSEPTTLSSIENRDDISPSPHSSNVSNIPDESPINDPHREICVYGTIKVHNQILDLWLYEAETRKVYVSVPKLSDKDIQQWINPAGAKPSWQDLDPYSSLEEIVSDDNNNIQLDTDNQVYNMRERKPKNITSHPHRKRKEINYIDLCDDNTDPPSPKCPK